MGLFDLKSKFEKNGEEFNYISLKDEDMFQKYIDETSYPVELWFTGFTYMYSYGQSRIRSTIWKIVDDMLCVFSKNNSDEIFLLSLPMGECSKEKLNDVIKKCFDIQVRVNGEKGAKPRVRTISDLTLDWLDMEIFRTKQLGYGKEHFYSIQRMTDLKGSDLAYIRRKINKFKRNNPSVVYREYNPDIDYDSMMALKRRWESTAGEKYFQISDGTLYKTILTDYNKFKSHKVFVAIIDGVIVGMMSGEYITSDHKKALCLLRKPMNNIEGLSEYLIHKTCMEFSEAEFLNDGADGDEGGLQFFKTRFMPLKSPEVLELSYIPKRNRK